MIERRYQYYGPGGKIMWTTWFKYESNIPYKKLIKQKPTFKNLKEEYRIV